MKERGGMEGSRIRRQSVGLAAISVLAAFFSLSAVPAAIASTITSSVTANPATGGVMTVAAPSGEANAITVSQSGSAIVVTDAAGIGLGSFAEDCVQDTPNQITCDADYGLILVSTGDGGSQVAINVPALHQNPGAQVSTVPQVVVAGGAGNDTIDVSGSGAVNAALQGCGGNDSLTGGPGNDQIDMSQGLLSGSMGGLKLGCADPSQPDAGDDHLV